MEETPVSLEQSLALLSSWINRRLRRLSVERIELRDAKQEIYLALVEYFRACEEKGEQPSRRAMYRLVGETLYQIIRAENHEHLCPESQRVLFQLEHPLSLDRVWHLPAPGDLGRRVEAGDFLLKVKKHLSKTELPIYEAMLAGCLTPRAVVAEIGSGSTKNVSFHMARIRRKAKALWRIEGG